MNDDIARLRSSIQRVRRQWVIRSAIRNCVQFGMFVLPIAATLVAVDIRFGEGAWIGTIILVSALLSLIVPCIWAWTKRGSLLHSAIILDDRAELKDRISSAWEFLRDDELDAFRLAQIHDAIERAESLDTAHLFRPELGRKWLMLCMGLIVFVMSFLIPPLVIDDQALASITPRKVSQIEQLQILEKELEELGEEDTEIKKVLEKLKKIDKEFSEGDMSERDLMIELGRLEQELAKQMGDQGVENLSEELEKITPHLAANEMSSEIAKALEQKQFSKASEELKKLGEKLKQGKMSKEQLQQLSKDMKLAGSKTNSDKQNSFGKDLKSASESIKEGNNKKSDKFSQASKSMSNKFSQLGTQQSMKKMRNQLKMTKSMLGQQGQCPNPGKCDKQGKCDGSGQCQGQGKKPGQGQGQKPGGQGNKPGGLEAGSGSDGTLDAERQRLEKSFKEMMKVTGIQVDGETQSQTEVLDGGQGTSQMSASDLYAEYASVAEQAIEHEDIPVSHRHHVKEYFQAIRPEEE